MRAHAVMTTGKWRELRRERAGAIGFVIIAFSITAVLLFGRGQTMTGDEPRYLMFAYSILKNGRFLMSLSEWQQLYLSVTGNPWPYGAISGDAAGNSVYVPTLLSPVANLFALSGLRAVTLMTGIIGLLYLFRLCRRFASSSGSLLATAVAGICIPLLPYLHLFYMETFLFALVGCAWDRLQKPDRTALGDLATAVVILAIPFAHMRGSVVAAALYALLLRQQWRKDRVRAILLTILAGAAFAAFVALNLAIYGAVTGPVNVARPMFPSEWLSVLPMQGFNVRHGLIAFAPVWLCGYAGLCGGSLRGISIVRQGLLLAIIAALTGVGFNAGECWPARFWVLSVPMLGVGLCAFWELGRSVLLRAIAVILLGATLANTAYFTQNPNGLLENRQSTATYQQMFDAVGNFNFGLMLPAEVDDSVNRRAARNLAIGAGVIVVLLTLALVRRQPFYAIPVLVLLLAAIDLSRVGMVPPAEYDLNSEPEGFELALHAPMSAGYVQFGRYWEEWYLPPERMHFSVVVTGSDGAQASELLAANQVISVSCADNIRTISVEGPPDFDFASQLKVRFIVYRSRSLLRALFKPLHSGC